MTPAREAYLLAARSAAGLIGDPAVAAAWAAPSALAELSVGGLAAHLAAQITMVHAALAAPPAEVELVTLLGHYDRVRWIGADLDADINVAIRGGSEQAAADGASGVVDAVTTALAELPAMLEAAPPDRRITPPAGPWSLIVDDFVTTRMLEITVHSDDLACSVALATPDLPASVLDPVLAVLTHLAVRRHGQPAVIRALARSERAPATVSAF